MTRDGSPARIAFTFENTLPSSAADAEVFLNTAAALARRGHDGTLVAPGDPREAEAFGAEVREYHHLKGPLKIEPIRTALPSLGAQHLRHAATFPYCETARESDFIYTRHLLLAVHSLRAGRRVFFDHYRPWGDQFPPLQPMVRYMFGHPGFIGMVAHSEVARQAYLRIGAREGAIKVCHNGFSPERMSPELTQAEAREKLGFPQDAKIVVYTGRINHKKGLEIVLEMARQIPDTTFVLVGSEGHGTIEQAAESIPNVKIVGWQHFSDTAPYLYAADVLIIPPSAAPMNKFGSTVLPLKVYLYLSAGRVIFAADTPDVAELLKHDDNSVLVRAGDEPAIVASLKELLADPERMKRLGASAKALSETLTWDARAERIEGFIYERLASRPSTLHDGWDRRRWATECGRWLKGGLTEGKWVATHAGPPAR